MKDQVLHMPHPSKVTKRLIFFTAVCTITGFDYVSHGSNFLEPYVKTFANESLTAHYPDSIDSSALRWIWSFTSTSRSIAALIGYFVLPLFMDKLGRRVTGMFWANVLLVVSCRTMDHSVVRAYNRAMAPVFTYTYFFCTSALSRWRLDWRRRATGATVTSSTWWASSCRASARRSRPPWCCSWPRVCPTTCEVERQILSHTVANGR